MYKHNLVFLQFLLTNQLVQINNLLIKIVQPLGPIVLAVMQDVMVVTAITLNKYLVFNAQSVT